MTITDATGQALIAAWRAKYPGAGWPTLSDAKEMLCAALANGKALLSNELLPCPVCGSAFLISQEPHDNHLVAGKFYIFHEYGPIGSAARACPIDVPKHFDTREEAIAAWNRRTPDPELLAARRTIEEMTGEDLWPDDPAPIADKAADHVFKDLAKVLGLETWSPQDGSETWEGDVWATLMRILTDAGVIDPETGEREDRWQDIATAPKDGTHVQVAFAGTSSPQTVAHWFGPTDLPGLRAGHWYLSVQQLEGPPIHPTHWRPLPAAPALSNSGDQVK